MTIDSYSFCEDGFQARLIQGLLGNKPFLRHFFRQYLTSLNDNEYEEESYGSGSALEFHGNELEQIDNPSIDLINKCKEVINLFKEVAQ